MLYNIIRDFFVQHVWGGTNSNGVFYASSTGKITAFQNGQVVYTYTGGLNDILSSVSERPDGVSSFIGLDDWLSTTSTIITMVAILIVIALFIRWLFKVVSNSILLR